MYIDQTLRVYLDDLASSNSTPGGGSAAAVSGAMAAALACMVCRLTLGKPKYADVEEEITTLLEKAEEHRERFQQLMTEDIEAYGKLSSSFKMPRDTEEQRETRADALQKGLVAAAQVPLEIAERANALTRICERIAEIGNANVISDIGASTMLASSAGTAAAWMVRINIKSFRDKNLALQLGERMAEALEEIEKHFHRVTELVRDRT